MRPLFPALLLLFALPLHAHEGLHEQIAAVTRAIGLEPRNASLYLKRGELHRLHREWQEAERDYARALELDEGNRNAIDLARGRMLFDSGRAADALPPLRRYAQAVPLDPNGHVALARALRSAGRAGDAADEFRKGLPPSQPDPDVALEYVAALAAAGRRDDALRYLDGLPPLVTFRLAAIDLELRAGNLAAALRRVEAAEAAASRKEEWMERRGDVLLKMGRAAAACAAYQSALDAIATLPPERRRSRAIVAMEQRLRARVAPQ